jgi:ubiquinone biosynthesis protein Coq4
MQTIKLNYWQKSYRKAVELSKVGGIIWLLQKTHNAQFYAEKLNNLKNMPEGTVGKAIADLLQKNQLKLIPRFECHDLKHVLLGYGMNAEDELKMQAFLLGNGNFSLPCLLFLSLSIGMPEIWQDLAKAFQKGRKAKSVLRLNFEFCIKKSLLELRQELNINI